jgi:hypothetical protein
MPVDDSHPSDPHPSDPHPADPHPSDPHPSDPDPGLLVTAGRETQNMVASCAPRVTGVASIGGAGRETQNMVASCAPRVREGAFVAFALAQYGVFSLEHAIAFGFSAPSLRARQRAQRLYRIHHGVYSLVPPSLLSHDARRFAAVLACGPGAVASHQTAAALFGLMHAGGGRIDVTVPSRAGRSRRGITIHRSSTLRACDTTAVRGIPCTTVARTALDLADVLPRRSVERLLDEAVALDCFNLATLEEQVQRNAARSRASRTLHEALTEHRPGSTRTDGEIGERMLAIVRAAGLPDPEIQAWVDLEDGEPMIRPDFLWRQAKVILETDGGIHRRGRRVAEDGRRDQRAARAGWQTLRVSWNDIVGEPARVGATLLAVVTGRLPRRANLPRAGHA